MSGIWPCDVVSLSMVYFVSAAYISVLVVLH